MNKLRLIFFFLGVALTSLRADPPTTTNKLLNANSGAATNLSVSGLTTVTSGTLNLSGSSKTVAASGAVVDFTAATVTLPAITGTGLSLANGSILIGGTDSKSHAQTMSGDATLANTGTVTLASAASNSGTMAIGNGYTVTNAKGLFISFSAPTNLLTNSLTSALFFVGNGSNVATGVAMSGDATIANTGALTLASVGTSGTVAIGNGYIAHDAKGREISFSTPTNLLTNSLTSGNVLIGNVSNVATSAALSGDVTLSNSGTATVSKVSGLPIIILQDQKSTGVAGGTFTSGAWQLRDLNTIVKDTAGICTLSSGTFSLPSGTYYIRALAPAYNVNAHQARLFNITGATDGFGDTITGGPYTGGPDTMTGIPAYAYNFTMSNSSVEGYFTLSGSTNLRVEHQCQTTEASDGFGHSTGFSHEKYTTVFLIKLK